jgi:phosphopantothenate synthetase
MTVKMPAAIHRILVKLLIARHPTVGAYGNMSAMIYRQSVPVAMKK